MFGFGSKYENITAAEIKNEMDQGAIVLDIRNDQAFASGHIKGAINIPIRNLPFNMSKLDKDKTVLVICYVGGSSRTAANILTKAGYTVKNVVGGMESYNGPLVK